MKESFAHQYPDRNPDTVFPSVPSTWPAYIEAEIEEDKFAESQRRLAVLRAQALFDEYQSLVPDVSRSAIDGSPLTEDGPFTADDFEPYSLSYYRRRTLEAMNARRRQKGEIVAFARDLRRLALELNLYPHQRRLREWIANEPLLVESHTTSQCWVHWDLMSDPRTNVKPRASRVRSNQSLAESTSQVENEEEVGIPSATGTLPSHADSKTSSESVAPPRFRSILRHIFYSRLPGGTGTWFDVAREMEKLAYNSVEIGIFRRAFEHTDQPKPDEPTKSKKPTLAEEAQKIEPSQRPLEPLYPAPYSLVMSLAQGRYQGLTYERSIRATLSKSPEFIVVGKERVRLNPRSSQEQGLESVKVKTPHRGLPKSSRVTSVYGLNQEILQKQLKLEQLKSGRTEESAKTLSQTKDDKSEVKTAFASSPSLTGR